METIPVIILFLSLTGCSGLSLKPYNDTAARMFKEEDYNGDGLLAPIESVGAFFKFDANRNYRIERNEYICYQIFNQPEIGSFATAIFGEYDYNNDTVLEESDLLYFFDRMDANADSNITQSEFIHFWTQLFIKHEHYLLQGHVHPLHNPHACQQLSNGTSNVTWEDTVSAVFAEQDADRNGKLSINENIGSFFKFDFNGDSRIERNEYICYNIIDRPEIGHFANAVFDEYDNNNDSVLERSDLVHFYNSMDQNGDGEVEKSEFVKYWVMLSNKHSGYLEGKVHPAHNPQACQHVNIGLSLKPYNETAARMFKEEDYDGDGLLAPIETVGAFFKFDANRNYRIERNEYICYQIFNQPEIGSFATAIFEEYDYNNDTVLEESDLLYFFDRMDANADSNITQSEFIHFWTKLFIKHEHYLLQGHVHPLHNPHACQQLSNGTSNVTWEDTVSAVFAEQDADRNGKLSVNENIGSFFKFDFNGDSRIERNEYICYNIIERPEIGHFANAVFDEYDNNNDSVLERSDLVHFYNSMDQNGDGEVEKSEFVKYWVMLFNKHSEYLGGKVHPAHNPRACQHVNIGFNFHPYDKYAAKMFTSEDGNSDGELSIAESLQSFNHYDRNGDKNISRVEYACYHRDLHPGLGDFAHAVFDEYDSDKNDILSRADIEGFYRKMDKDSNSIVTQAEYVDFWEQIFQKYEKYHMHGTHHQANSHTCPGE